MLIHDRLNQIAEMYRVVLQIDSIGASVSRLPPSSTLPDREIPRVLSMFYNLCSKESKVMLGYLEFTPVEKLAPLRDGYIVICRDDQGAFQWSIESRDTDTEDPRVYQRSNSQMPWNYYQRHLSAFLNGAVAWQILHTLPRQAMLKYDEAVAESLVNILDFVPCLCQDEGPFGNDIDAMFTTGVMACGFPTAGQLYFGGRNRTDLENLERGLNRPLAWSK